MSGIKDFEKKLLEDKKKKFILEVKKSAKKIGINLPNVKIWDCPKEKDNEIAHCHTESGMICISEYRLKNLNKDEIIETATHEVSHLLHGNHSPMFHETHQKLKAETWRPPSGMGLSHISSNDPVYIRKPEKIVEDRKNCNYYQIKEHKKGKLSKCKYCERQFCNNHKKPRPANVKDISNYNKISRDLQEEAENPRSHPCLRYNHHFIRKAEEQSERYGDALDRTLGRKTKFVFLPKKYSLRHKGLKKNFNKENKDSNELILDEVYGRYNEHQQSGKEIHIKNYNIFVSWLNERNHRKFRDWHGLFINIIWLIGISIVVSILWTNLRKLNEIVLLILPIGGTLLLVSLFFWIKYAWRFLKKAKRWFEGERNWVRYLIIILILILLWQGYQNRETVLDPVIEMYNSFNFSEVLPLSANFTMPDRETSKTGDEDKDLKNGGFE